MAHSESTRRRLADALVRGAGRVMPPGHQPWADAMRNEMAYTADDHEALRWAIGCLRAASLARIRGLYLLDVPAVRAAGALFATLRAFGAVFPTLLTLAYRQGSLGMTERLGRMTPGDDFHRLVPLMEAIPVWVHALAAAEGACYLAAVICLLARWRAAYVALLAGVSLEFVLTVFGRALETEVGVAAVPDPSFLAAVLLPFVLPLLLALAAWSGSRRFA
jgi:hypothetical protein